MKQLFIKRARDGWYELNVSDGDDWRIVFLGWNATACAIFAYENYYGYENIDKKGECLL